MNGGHRSRPQLYFLPVANSIFLTKLKFKLWLINININLTLINMADKTFSSLMKLKTKGSIILDTYNYFDNKV